MLVACLMCTEQSVEKVLYFDKSIYVLVRVNIALYYYCLIMHNFVLAYIRFYILV